MKEYLDMVKHVLGHGNLTQNRTGVTTFTDFSYNYKVDITNKFPILTTKEVRTNSMIREVLWYLSGEEHVRNLSKHTKIWNDWANENGNLETAYGRYWRRWPIHEQRLDGEALAGAYGSIDIKKYIHTETNDNNLHKTLDQVSLVRDLILNDPESRRMVITAWNPANAFASKLPPCHYTFVFDVAGDKLNCALTQRSGDIALGIPFNLAAYSLLTKIIAMQTQIPEYHAQRILSAGIFSHTIINAHIYCGIAPRSLFYIDNKEKFQKDIRNAKNPEDFANILGWIDNTAPPDPKLFDHVPGLLLQCTRQPTEQPTIVIAQKPLDELVYEDFQIIGYEHDDPIKFGVAV